jgi:tRNA A-37 threonylcarbamoyl transferase component Bud32
MSIVVMDIVEGQMLKGRYDSAQSIADESLIRQVREAANALKTDGFVYGDPRRPYIVLLTTPSREEECS